MTMISSSELQLDVPAGALDADVRPPGERYFRHPGDVLRLLLWGAVTAVLRSSSRFRRREPGRPHRPRTGGRRPDSFRELVLAVIKSARSRCHWPCCSPERNIAGAVSGSLRRWRGVRTSTSCSIFTAS
jgi:hypothetical protein